MNTNLIGNRISLDIPDADLQAIQAAVKALEDLLVPHLVDLSPGARMNLARMGPKTVDFVSKTLTYTLANPQLVKAFVDVDEFQRDFTAVSTLRSLQGPLNNISHLVDSSLMLSGSEAYQAALECYNSFKAAAKQSLPNAIPISADLSERFAKISTKAAAAAKVRTTAIVDDKAPPAIKGSRVPQHETERSDMTA